jgi:hypothetical protein
MEGARMHRAPPARTIDLAQCASSVTFENAASKHSKR